MDFLKTLNNKIIINDVIVKKMQYDISMLFINYTSTQKAEILSRQIHSQINNALMGVNNEDKDRIKKLIILDSFLILKNPISNSLSYGNVFTTLTNYDNEFIKTKVRLADWLDQNTDIEYDDAILTTYIKTYKLRSTTEELIKVAETEYEHSIKGTKAEADNKPIDNNPSISVLKRLKGAIYFLPIFIILITILIFDKSYFFKTETKDKIHITTESYNNTGKPSTTSLLEKSFFTDLKVYVDSYNFFKETGIPYEFQYKNLNIKNIYGFLNNKNSLLSEEDYLNVIINISKEYNVNTLLLLSIIGQEQAFVPKDHEDVMLIINNPYNVFGSWKDYNTSLEETTRICLNTILSSAKKRPEEYDFIKWLNTTYAKDKIWSEGVSSIFTSLQNINLK